MLEVDYTSNNKVTNKPPKVTIIEGKGGRPKKEGKVGKEKVIHKDSSGYDSKEQWRQEIRKMLPQGTKIDAAGYIHGVLRTGDIKAIIEAGGRLMVYMSGQIGIGNWRKAFQDLPD